MAKIILNKDMLMIDEQLDIKVITPEPGQRVAIRVEMVDEEDKTFISYADFTSNGVNEIDLSTFPPSNGTYDEPDSAGLLWSMIRKDTDQDDYFVKKSDGDLEATIYVMDDEKILATETVTFQFRNGNVEELEITHPDLKGNLYSPREEGIYPSVLILSGSDGGNEAHAAAYLAAKGYLALSLSYFNDEGLNEQLESIELTYFKQATEYLSSHQNSTGDVNLIGFSKGGELALLISSLFNSYRTIIAGSPANYVTSGMKGGVFAPVTGWIYKGETVPYLKLKYPVSFMLSSIKNYIKKQPMNFLAVWRKSLNHKKTGQFKINVADIEAPLFIISGVDDKLWPSPSFQEEIKKERTNQADKYLSYKNAGHFSSFPYNFHQMPANVHLNLDGLIMNFGGTKRENAYSAKESLTEILGFLNENNR